MSDTKIVESRGSSLDDFAEECRRQSRLVAQADTADTDMQNFMDEALADLDGWTE